MEKKIGKNISSGAQKVETVEKELSAADVDPKPSAKTKKTAVKKTASKTAGKKDAHASASRKTAESRAEKREKEAAEKRVEKAKARAQKKEKKLMHRAELKQTKIEKKAALREKKLEKKAAAAERRAERKQRKIDRAAELKSKKAENRAAKIARRETLRHESKAEKQKRLARGKKDRLALRRQRREARNEARENKRKSREAAHARKAEDKKHRREQKTERRKHAPGFGGWLAAVISLGVLSLALATVVTAGAINVGRTETEIAGSYRATLFEMVSVSEDMDDNLTKLRASSGENEQRRLLTDLLVDSALMESALERIPVDSATGTDISAFVNRTGSYCRTLLARLAAGESLGETEKNTLAYLDRINSALYAELNELATHMTESEFRAFLKGKDGKISQKFGEMGQGTLARPEEAVDAPFSGEGNVGENKLDALKEVSASRAEELVKEYLSGYHVREVRLTGETNAKAAECYNFILTDENDAEIYAEITKKGGKLAFFDTYEVCTQKNFDLAACDSLAREFLSSLGIENVEAVWLSDTGMVADITYVSNDGGVRAYPDMVRVRVCESRGRVVGMEAMGYLTNSGERDLSAGISEEEARNALSPELTVREAHRALIPVEGRETLAYEFYCALGEDEYIVYLDASTGEEIQVYRVRESARGSYLR